MPNIFVEWSDVNVTILKQKTSSVELGSLLPSCNNLARHIRSVVRDRQGVVVGVELLDLANPYWTWLTLSEAVVSVFGFQPSPVLVEVLKTDPTGLLDEAYERHHGRAFILKD